MAKAVKGDDQVKIDVTEEVRVDDNRAPVQSSAGVEGGFELADLEDANNEMAQAFSPFQASSRSLPSFSKQIP
jgi:hypothetical protein